MKKQDGTAHERFVEVVAQAKAHKHSAAATFTSEQLMECLAEGQARVMDFATASLHLDRRKHFPAEAEKLEAAYAAAFTKLLEWAFNRDNMNERADPMKIIWAFRQRAFDEARDGAIKDLEEALAVLKRQRPKEPT